MPDQGATGWKRGSPNCHSMKLQRSAAISWRCDFVLPMPWPPSYWMRSSTGLPEADAACLRAAIFIGSHGGTRGSLMPGLRSRAGDDVVERVLLQQAVELLLDRDGAELGDVGHAVGGGLGTHGVEHADLGHGDGEQVGPLGDGAAHGDAAGAAAV